MYQHLQPEKYTRVLCELSLIKMAVSLNFKFLMLLFVLIISSAVSSSQSTSKPLSILEHISRKSNTFGLSVYQRFPKDAKTANNFLISPLSLFVGFSQVCLGARGSTKEEMTRELMWTGDDEQFMYFVRPWYVCTGLSNTNAPIFINVITLPDVSLLFQIFGVRDKDATLSMVY